ncbi:hypothetical protein K4754_27440 [Pseudomonas glycinae]|uniref:hypothetical protein n=1 Tax=Pseudomonas glycinae TaxID=1785145 RepID=UPI001C891DF5|nr:hypothetical protein [Pseudomonas glycinae]MBX8625795.1 hypothetical protein [Pseudomonas glycinae]
MKFQVSLFGDFSLLTPTEDNIKKCIEGFFASGLLPGNLQEFDPQSNKMEARLSLQSMRNGITVNVLRNRIDFLATPLPGSPAASLKLENFFQEVIKFSDLLKNTFDVSFKRPGVIVEKFLKELSEERLDEIRRTFIQDSFSVIPDANVAEWNIRNVSSCQFAEPVNQEANVIYSIAKVKVQMGDATGHREFDTLHLSVDINIPTEKRNANLSREYLESFLAKAQEMHSIVYKGLTAVIYGAN